MVNRGDVYWVMLDPTVGTEMRKTRPCLIISADDMNDRLPRVIIAPITSKGQKMSCRPEIVFAGKQGQIALDQLRSIDKSRMGDYIDHISPTIWHQTLLEMLA